MQITTIQTMEKDVDSGACLLSSFRYFLCSLQRNVPEERILHFIFLVTGKDVVLGVIALLIQVEAHQFWNFQFLFVLFLPLRVNVASSAFLFVDKCTGRKNSPLNISGKDAVWGMWHCLSGQKLSILEVPISLCFIPSSDGGFVFWNKRKLFMLFFLDLCQLKGTARI